jgi:hypothetical protein
LRERARDLHRAIAHQRPLVEQRLHDLLDEERIAACAFDYQTLERINLDRIAQHGREQLLDAFPAQRVKRELDVVALVGPFMAVLGAIVDK